MLGWLFRFLLALTWRAGTLLFIWLVGAIISAVVRFGPPFYRLSVAVTDWILFQLDAALGGRLSRRWWPPVLGAGGLWALTGLLAPWLLASLWTWQVASLSPFWPLAGFVYGLVCGNRVRRLPGWGSWAEEEGMQLGENIR